MTLVELMVGLAIGLVISLAAAALYLIVSESSRGSKAQADVNETGKLALDLIGRELQKAGFYPAQYPSASGNTNMIGDFSNTKGAPAFDNGLFGCDGAAFDAVTKACGTPAEDEVNSPDSVVVNYFAFPEFGLASLMGNFTDCNRRPVTSDPDNAKLIDKGVPKSPLYVSNRFALVKSTYTGASGTSVSTHTLGCNGNGKEGSATYEAHVQGIEDMVIRYGLYEGAVTQSPSKFLSATDVAKQPPVGAVGPWKRVTAVKICIVVRSLDNGRVEAATADRAYPNCRGGSTTPAAGDNTVYRRFERVYAIRNNLTIPL